MKNITDRINIVKEIISSIRSYSFDMRHFKELSDNDEINWKTMISNLLNYCDFSGLQYLGAGSSRKTYILSGKKVLKVAMNQFGLEQNKAEVLTSKETKLVPKIYEYCNTGGVYYWLISEMVRPLNEDDSSELEFEELAGISWYEYKDYLFGDTDTDNEFAHKMRDFANRHGLIEADMCVLDHYGVTAEDRRLVLLDSGFNEDNRHYNAPAYKRL
jgi:hypothetical protein